MSKENTMTDEIERSPPSVLSKRSSTKEEDLTLSNSEENPMNNETEKTTEPEYEKLSVSDYFVGSLFVIIGVTIWGLVGLVYWNLHGGSIDNFSFWTTGDKKWLEALFWSFLTGIAWNVTSVAFDMRDQIFQKRDVFSWLGRILEAPLISFALVFVLTNLGVAFGDTTISLSQAPITVVIAFAIISAYFAPQTIQAIGAVADWFQKQVRARLGLEDDVAR